LSRALRLRNNPWAVLVLLCLGLFMTLLDITIVQIAIPSLSLGLHASLDQVLWVVNAYSLLYAVLLITAGRLGDIFGPRNLFAGGLGVFTLASALSGLAQSPEQLIAARALQGLGAAIAGPQGLPIMLSVFPPDKRGGVFATYGILGGLAVLAGPTLGGLLVTDLGWRWIFYVNIPVGAATIALAFLLVPDLRPGRSHRLDLGGVLLATLGLLGIVYGLIEGERYGWGSVIGPVTIPAIIVAGVLVLVAFLVQQALRQRGEPLLPFAVFKDRNFSLMIIVMACLGFALVGFYLPLTIYLQTVLGLSAIAAGLTIAPQPLAMMFTFGFAASLVGKVNGKWLLLPGLLVFTAGMGYIDWVPCDRRTLGPPTRAGRLRGRPRLHLDARLQPRHPGPEPAAGRRCLGRRQHPPGARHRARRSGGGRVPPAPACGSAPAPPLRTRLHLGHALVAASTNPGHGSCRRRLPGRPLAGRGRKRTRRRGRGAGGDRRLI
jgi:EmrB/QacA subfamily drug resistance transporter